MQTQMCRVFFVRGGNVYLHGLLEQINGYDICGSTETLPTKDGEYPCTVIMLDGDRIEATLYLWHVNIGRDTIPKGLVVALNDKQGNVYGKRKLKEKPWYI